jgi:hypothetical protein
MVRSTHASGSSFVRTAAKICGARREWIEDMVVWSSCRPSDLNQMEQNNASTRNEVSCQDESKRCVKELNSLNVATGISTPERARIQSQRSPCCSPCWLVLAACEMIRHGSSDAMPVTPTSLTMALVSATVLNREFTSVSRLKNRVMAG